MSEGSPQQENMDSPVPEYILDQTLLGANFLMPADGKTRNELRHQLEDYSRYGIMTLSENKKAQTILLARLAAIEAYDAVMLEAKKKSTPPRHK